MTQIPIEHRPPAPNSAPNPREVFELIERMRRRLGRLVAGASPALECGGSTPLSLRGDRQWREHGSPSGGLRGHASD